MTTEQLQSYKRNQRELAALRQSLDNLRRRLADVEVVSGKVSKSSENYPYVEEHVTVEMQKPEQADPIRKRIIEKEQRKAYLEQEIKAVDDYIECLPDSMTTEILELVYIDGMSQTEVGDVIGYTQSMVSKIIGMAMKGLEDSNDTGRESDR